MKNLLTKRFRKLMLRLALIGFICPMAYASAEYTQSTIYWGVYNDTLYISDSNTVTDGESISLTGSFSSDANFDGDTIPWKDNSANVLHVKVIGEVAPLSTASRFRNFNSCISMDLQGLDTSNVTDMSYMFYYSYSLVSLDVSNFDTSNVTNMNYMFYYCSSLESLNLGHFDVRKSINDLNGFVCGINRYQEISLSSDTREAIEYRPESCVGDYIVRTSPVYTVKHLKQNAGNDEYTLAATDKKVGGTGEQTAATAKKYKGFTAQAIEQGTILGDGSTVVNVYYDRNASEDNNHGIDLNIELTIEEGELSIGTNGGTETVTLSGSMAASLESKTVEKSLEKLFRVEDLKGSSKGYRTTISVTDMTGSIENVVYTIPAENIYLKATELVKESGTGEDVVLNSLLSGFQSMEEPVTFIQRGTGTTAGLLGKYGATPELKVVVPANMPGTTYKGTITYTLYENEY